MWSGLVSSSSLCAKLLPSCPTLCNPVDCSPPGSSVHGDSPGKYTGVGCHVLLQGIFLTQVWNPQLLSLLQFISPDKESIMFSTTSGPLHMLSSVCSTPLPLLLLILPVIPHVTSLEVFPDHKSNLIHSFIFVSNNTPSVPFIALTSLQIHIFTYT